MEIASRQTEQIKEKVSSYDPAAYLFFFFFNTIFFIFSCRLLSDWLGVLLHRGRSGDRHAALRLAVLFRREEAEALPVLKGAPERQSERKRDGWCDIKGERERGDCDSVEIMGRHSSI